MRPVAVVASLSMRDRGSALAHPGVALFATLWALGVLVPLSGLIVASFLGGSGMDFRPMPTLRAYVDVLGGFRLDVLLRTLRVAATITAIALLLAFPSAPL